jgi:alpha-amylase
MFGLRGRRAAPSPATVRPMVWRWKRVALACSVAVAACGDDTSATDPDGSSASSTGSDPDVMESTSSTGGTTDDEDTGSTSRVATSTAGEITEDGTSTGDPMQPNPYDGPRTVLVHLFEWSWDDVARECEEVLGPAGFAGVQVTPPQEHARVVGAPWWERYQPVSYTLDTRGGQRAAFAEMVERCDEAGVAIYVDAVLNHMAFADDQPGWGGTSFSKYDYPGLYGDENFHECRRGIEDWGSRYEIQNCELATLPDLATEQPYVREQLATYVQDLVDLGVAGFRLDAAKHIPAEDLTAIFSTVEPAPDLFQEIIDLGGDQAVPTSEYTPLGRVTEFRYGSELSRVFREGQLAWLESFGEAWGFVADQDALVFVDNHDNQRGHGAGEPLTHASAELYRLSVAFMLAWPYGRPKLMSSYTIDDGFHGPPRSDDGRTAAVLAEDGECHERWVCEHRWPAILAMVGFRNTTDGEPVEHWWSNGNDQIAFARGDRGFFALNREEASTLQRRLQTGLPTGTYCDVISGGVSPEGDACVGVAVEVEPSGEAELSVGPVSTVALHVDARAE